MWVTRCVSIARHAVATHPIAVGIPAAVTTVGAAAALALVCAKPTAAPFLPCGCHQVWIAPVVPMTPKTYAKVIQTAADAALNSIPTDNSGGIPYYFGSGGGFDPTTIPPTSLTNLPHVPGGSHVPRNVPEPSTLALLAAGCAGLLVAVGFRRRQG